MDNGYAQPGSRSAGADRADRSDAGGTTRTRSGDRSRPTLLVNPPSDQRLRERLDRAMDEDGPGTPGQLEALMRPEYPRIVVRARSLEHESVVVWYVYREGYWVPSTPDDAVAGGSGGIDRSAAAGATSLTDDDSS